MNKFNQVKFPRAAPLLLTIAMSISLIAPISARASDYQGYIQDMVQIGTRMYLYVGGGWFGTDNCGTGRTKLLVSFDATTSDGKSFVALALSSKAQSIQMYVQGASDCTTAGTPNGSVSETLYVLWAH